MDSLQHIGMPMRSGRYPYGSGEDPYQHTNDFLSRIDDLKASSKGITEREIAESFGLSTTQYRAEVSLAIAERRSRLVATAKGLREKGYNPTEIAAKMGYANESSIRSLLNTNTEKRMNQADTTAAFLKEKVDEKGMLDVGVGVERELGISAGKLKQSLTILEEEGYCVYGGRVPQATNPGKFTTITVLCPPGTEHKEIYDYSKIESVRDYMSHDNGQSFDKYVYPKSMDSERIGIRYAEEGGLQKDGLVEIRRGVNDLDMGNSHYAQVRILVDDSHYVKGMAVYSDNLPDGVDLMFNTNKKSGTPLQKVLKPIHDDPDNPFGSLIKKDGQSYYTDESGKKQLSLINKRAEEGDWDEWKDKLPSQFLSKQRIELVNKQLNLATADKIAEYDEICSLENPTVKRQLLQDFSDGCDSAAVHLQAASLPRQRYQVIIPMTTLADNEVYAPNYKPGEKVALVRYPHGGTFEIPILKVNNKNAEGLEVLGNNPIDAIGINSKVAERLSGADFDGDTVMVIPTGGKVNITSTPKLKQLEGFDPKEQYGASHIETDSDGVEHYYRSDGQEFKKMTNTQTEMGKISNLITDMTLKGASQDELASAVKHSMVVIDAEKHKLDYTQSSLDNNISALKKYYQGEVNEDGTYHEGASTLISRAKSQTQVLKRQGSAKIDHDTGEQIFNSVVEEYVDGKGKTKVRMQDSTKMAEAKDARTLSSGTLTEEAYASYANKMKALANTARKEMVTTGKLEYSKEANKEYYEEVVSLKSKLNVALMNAPRERRAQTLANSVVSAKIASNPDLKNKAKKGELKKIKQQALTSARLQVGAKRQAISVTDREWEAIQAGAISDNILTSILKNTDSDALKQRATPRTTTTLSTAKIARMDALRNSGYTTSMIAEALGVSSSTVTKYLKEKG